MKKKEERRKKEEGRRKKEEEKILLEILNFLFPVPSGLFHSKFFRFSQSLTGRQLWTVLLLLVKSQLLIIN
ncbi:hypothetical protein [Okeania sp. SIO2B3]|uniref:hypothetical protein n=1 Tax=Okeania sp. SIO2B3 TaxID=2607784 RepID=UPI0013C13451|nr:hypothetical protein [Okeania sp. SIO2B3]NET42846.1 hypothetical protein [Okeania sp. SIO2B3]